MDKECFTPDTQKFADSKVEDYPEQIYNQFQQFKLFYFGRSKTHQDDIKVADDKGCVTRQCMCNNYLVMVMHKSK